MNPAQQALTQNSCPEGWLPLLELSAREVFEIMLNSKLEPAGEDTSAPPSEFTAMVGLAGQLCGILTLRCSAQTASLMTCRMLGSDPAQAKEQMWDAIGEVCNMVAGNFKNKLTGMSDGCMLSVPTVITGADFTFHSLADAGSLELTMIFEGAPIQIALEVHS